MSQEDAIAWAKKMADVLGTIPKGAAGIATKLASDDEEAPATTRPATPTQPTGAKGAAGGNGASGASTGTPKSGTAGTSGAPPKVDGGGTTAADPSRKGASPGAPAGTPDGKPSVGDGGPPGPDAKGGGTDAPSFGAPPTAPTSQTAPSPSTADAKGHAEAAQKALADLNALLPQAKPLEAEAKKCVTDAQAEKKKIDAANTQLEAAIKGMPPVPKLPAPKGAEKTKERYDSAIQITGQMRKAQQDAEAKLLPFRSISTGQEAKANAAVHAQSAKNTTAKLKQFMEQAQNLATSAKTAADSAATAAAGSKQKADQAAKDSAATKKEDAGQKTGPSPAKDGAPGNSAQLKAAQDDAQHAKSAKEAASQAQAAVKQLEALSKTADAQNQSVEKLVQEINTAGDGFATKSSSIAEKSAPYADVVASAEEQEAKCKADLKAEDAEAVLNERYQKLGGDNELQKALASEDKLANDVETKLTAIQDEYLKRKSSELNEYKASLEKIAKDNEQEEEKLEAWMKPQQDKMIEVTKSAMALGPKLETEPGKELQHEIRQRNNTIADTQEQRLRYQGGAKQVRDTLAALNTRLDALKKENEAIKDCIAKKRTELNNELEMGAMSLEKKVDFLQTNPQPVRNRFELQLKNQIKSLQNTISAETKTDQVEFKPLENFEPPDINVAPVEAKIADLTAKSLEQLKEKDPQLAALQEEYDKAGGDSALFQKRTKEWQEKVESADQSDRQYAESHKQITEKLQAQLKSSINIADGQSQQSAILEKQVVQKEARLKLLGDKANSTEESAERALLSRELPNLKAQLAAQKKAAEASHASKESVEKLIEQQRVRFEAGIKQRASLPRPESADIHKMPIRAKYTELTGKTPPTNTVSA